MDAKESPLEVARRRVAEAEARVKDQAARVEQAARRGQNTMQAKAVLDVFEGTLRILREDLARLEADDPTRRQQ
jgi:outer membrane lipoprotein-sorting protein